MDKVILVDENDAIVGEMEKMEAHRKGLLHRAFSILIFNDSGEMLLQKRSSKKYHSGGLWTNACCSHPSPNENIQHATRRKLEQEMGIDLETEFLYTFIYHVSLEHDLTEHELDHVFVGTFNGTPVINRDEVEDWKYVNIDWLRNDVVAHPDNYTHWFKIILEQNRFLTGDE